MALIQTTTTVAPGASSAWVVTADNTNVLIGVEGDGASIQYRFVDGGLTYQHSRGRATPNINDGPVVLVGAQAVMITNVGTVDIQFEIYTP